MTRKCSPNWIEAYLKYTQYQQAPERFHIWTALSVLASAVQRNVYRDRVFFKTFPNLYVCITGPTGITKSTATDIGVDIFRELHSHELIAGTASSWYIQDWFIKRTGAGEDCCCTIYADEMKELLGDLNKSAMVTLLTTLYTCPHKKDFHLKGHGKKTFENVCVNILVCTTPEWLVTGTTMNEIHGGFTGRFVYIYEDKDRQNVAFPEDFFTPELLRLKQDLVDDLREIAKLKGEFYITDQAKAEYIIWYNQRKSEWGADERLRGYFARKGDLVLKIAMLLSVAKDDSLVIDESILHLAWAMLKQIETGMGGAFSGIVEDPAMKYKDLVLSHIVKAPGMSITRAKLLKDNWHKFGPEVLDRIIHMLEETKVVESTAKSIKGKSHIVYTLVDRSFC